MSTSEIDDLLGRFARGERTWELGTRLAAVLSAAGRSTEIPAMLAQCSPRKLASVGAVLVRALDEPGLAFSGWRLPPGAGGTAILDLGTEAHEVRPGDRFVIDFGGGMGAATGICDVGFGLVRDGKRLAGRTITIDFHMSDRSPEEIRDSLEFALKTLAATVGASVE